MLPVKLFHEHDKSARAAILTLVLALQLPLAQAEAMTRTLVHLGASTAQADLDQNTTLQYCIVEQPDLLKTLADVDSTGVSRAINHLSVSGYKWSPVISSPLMTAINARDSVTAIRLLGQGAKSEIEFSAYIKAYQTKNEPSSDSKRNKQRFQTSTEQPVVSAVQCELPDIAGDLVEHYHADPNTLAKSGWTVINNEHARNYTNGHSVLDEVRAKIKELTEWKPKENEAGFAPTPLQADSSYLSGLSEGSYRWWSSHKQVKDGKAGYHRATKAFQQNLERVGNKRGISEKQAAINAMLARFKTLEARLIAQGAKTFKELYPHIEEAQERQRCSHNYNPAKPKAFKVEFVFQLPDLTDETQERYMRLFESAWTGDQRTVKELTLLPWKSSDGEDQPPLKITTTDQHKLSPFSIAVLRGHLDLATTVMEIAQAQYLPPDAPKRERHRLAAAADGGDDDEEGSDSDVQIVSELVDETFTVETVGQVSTQTKSQVKPVSMILWTIPVQAFGRNRPTATSKSSIPAPTNMLQFAVHFGNEALLDYLLSLGEKYTKLASPSDSDDAEKFFAIPDNVYRHAIALDLPHILAKLIKRTGAGIPMDQLIKQSGVEIKEKSKYYQGLSVYGKKRQDWAAKGPRYRRNYSSFSPLNSSRPPL